MCYERLAKVRRWWLFLTGNVASELGRLVVGIHVHTLFVDKGKALKCKDNEKVSEGVQGSKGRATRHAVQLQSSIGVIVPYRPRMLPPMRDAERQVADVGSFSILWQID